MNESLGRQFRPKQPSSEFDVSTEHGSAKVSLIAPGQCYVYDIEVDKRMRGHGHGSYLLGLIVDAADKRGDVLTVSAREEHHDWYKRFGFEVQPKETFLGLPVLKRHPASQ